MNAADRERAHGLMVRDAQQSGYYDDPVALRGYSEGVEHALERAESYREANAAERHWTGPENYREAERLIEVAGEYLSDSRRLNGDSQATRDRAHRFADTILARAQVHATLALAAATALGVTTAQFGDTDQLTEWAEINRTTQPEKEK
ncbi:hypothetical protein ACWFRB_09430 [Rhodococcus sp. NPDC055112]